MYRLSMEDLFEAGFEAGFESGVEVALTELNDRCPICGHKGGVCDLCISILGKMARLGKVK